MAALGRGLRDEFPNPERVGCPSREIVAAIAAHKMPLSQAGSYLDHLTSCSPCYRDFLQLQTETRKRRTQMIFAVAASVLIVAGLATWAMLHQHNSGQVAAVVDLRDRSMARGTEPPPTEAPLKIPHNISRLYIYLPLGSSEGPYEIRISGADGGLIFAGQAMASFRQGVASLSVDVAPSSARPGQYALELRKVGSEWNSFPMRIE